MRSRLGRFSDLFVLLVVWGGLILLFGRLSSGFLSTASLGAVANRLREELNVAAVAVELRRPGLEPVCVGVGDPATDVMVAWKVLFADTRGIFRTALSVNDATWARARGWAVSQAVIALS